METRQVVLGAAIFAAMGAFGAYVTDGLVLRYDAIDNAGDGVHMDAPTVWKDLSGNGYDLTLPASGVTVGADTIAFNNAGNSVSGISCLADTVNTTNLTLEVVCATGEFSPSASAHWVAGNPRIILYFRQPGAQGMFGGCYYDGSKRQFAGFPVRCCEWNSMQFIQRFHTYSLMTASSGGSIAVDGSSFATLQSPFTNVSSTPDNTLWIGGDGILCKIKSVRLYSRHLTETEVAQNAAEDEMRFSIKPATDANGNANAFDDAAFYFRAARQTSNTYLDQYEFANALYIGSANDPVGDTLTVDGSWSNIAIETMDVPAPYADKTLRNRSVLHFKQPYKSGYEGSIAYSSKLTLNQPVAATNKASYTVMLRFKVESRMKPEDTGAIYLLRLGYGYSAQSGLDLQLYGPDDNLYVRAYHGSNVDDFTDMQSDSAKTLKVGEWVDMAITVDGRVNRLYYKTESGKWYEGVQNVDVALTQSTGELYKLVLGGYGSGSAYYVSNEPRAFRGWYQQVAVWDRALTRDEVLNAFRDGCDDGDEWKVGVANDMSLEFAGSGAADLTSVNDWRNMKGTLSAADDAVSVNFSLAADSYAKVRTFKFKTTSVSADGALSLAVNGRTVAQNVTAASGQSAVVTVPGGFFASGANTLTVTRTDSSSGAMEIDCMSLVVAEGDVSVADVVADDPFSGAYRWYRHDGEAFKDILRTAYPNSEAHKWTESGPSGNVINSTMDVVCPARGVTLVDEKCIYFKQETKTVDNQVYGKYGYISTPIFPVSNTVAHTSFVRFKIDSFQDPAACKAQIYGMGYDWTNGRGLAVWLEGSDPDNLKIGLGCGKTNIEINDMQNGDEKNRLAQGKWIDLAVVMSNACAYVYASVEGGDFMNLGSHAIGAGGSGEPALTGGLYIGTCRNTASANWSSVAQEFFRGWIHQAAVWPCALSEKEVKAVFGFPSPEIAHIGVANGSAAEFYGSGATTYTYSANADFRDAPSVIPAGGSLTLTFDLAAGDVRSQLIKIAATADSASATFAVSVNGKRITNYTEQYVPLNEFTVASGGSAVVGVLSRYLQTGVNTVTLTRIDSGTGAFEIDALSFGNGDKISVRGSGFTLSFK